MHLGGRDSNERLRSEMCSPSVGSSKTVRSHSPSKYDRDGIHRERRDYKDDTRRDSRSVRQRCRYSDRRYSEDSQRDRNKYEYSSRRTPGQSDWDDGRWEWEKTPPRDGHSTPSRSHCPLPAPMLVGSSPDTRLVSQWLGDTPYSAGSTASP
ncbi:hypothetical protein MKX01_020646 [Papaver californicum]|nr:hypothetical protein MKX01_020646 [Papaver californicum]